MMLVRKIVLCGAFIFFAFPTHFVFADDENYSLAPAAHYPSISPPPETNFGMRTNNICYIEGHAGYARQNYFDNAQWQANAGVNVNNNSNVNGGFVGGGDVGYRINRHYAIEAGGFQLPAVNINPGNLSPSYLTSWVVYFVAKYIVPVPIMHHTDLFFKLGAAYREATVPSNATIVTGSVITQRHSKYIRPTFATGLEYAFNKNFSGIFQYFYFMGANNSFGITAAPPVSGAMSTVNVNVFTIGLNYRFNV